jgi:hypothetical protein
MASIAARALGRGALGRSVLGTIIPLNLFDSSVYFLRKKR